MKKKILICGATGFIGQNVLNHFTKIKNYKVIALINKTKPDIRIKSVKYIKGNLKNFRDCLRVTKNIDIVIQCAATTSGSKDIINAPYLHVTDNAVMNSNILRSVYENKVGHFLFMSCTVMYKNSRKYLSEKDVNENKIFPNYYGVAQTKLYIEKICKFYSNISKTKFTIIRHSNIYGYNDKFDIDKGHFIGSTIKKIYSLKHPYIKVFGSGKEKRDFLFVDDLINFIEKSIKNQRKQYDIFNCTYGKSYSIKEILKKLIIFSKTNKSIQFNKNARNLNVNILVKSNKAKKEINWGPKIKLDNGLKLTLKWFKSNEKFL